MTPWVEDERGGRRRFTLVVGAVRVLRAVGLLVAGAVEGFARDQGLVVVVVGGGGGAVVVVGRWRG